MNEKTVFEKYCLQFSLNMLIEEREKNKEINLALINVDELIKENLIRLRKEIPLTINLYEVKFELYHHYTYEGVESSYDDFHLFLVKQFLLYSESNYHLAGLLKDLEVHDTLREYKKSYKTTNQDTLDIVLSYLILTDKEYQDKYNNIALNVENLLHYGYYLLQNISKFETALIEELPKIFDFINFAMNKKNKIPILKDNLPIILSIGKNVVIHKTIQLTPYSFVDKLESANIKIKNKEDFLMHQTK